jgi:hypothetical protein
MALPPEVIVAATEFERFTVENTGVYVSVCRVCFKFIAAAPDPVRLAMAETLHRCSRGLKKPAARALPLQLRRMRAGLVKMHPPESRE